MTCTLIALAWIVLAGLTERLHKYRMRTREGEPGALECMAFIAAAVLLAPVALYRWIAGE